MNFALLLGVPVATHERARFPCYIPLQSIRGGTDSHQLIKVFLTSYAKLHRSFLFLCSRSVFLRFSLPVLGNSSVSMWCAVISLASSLSPNVSLSVFPWINRRHQRTEVFCVKITRRLLTYDSLKSKGSEMSWISHTITHYIYISVSPVIFLSFGRSMLAFHVIHCLSYRNASDAFSGRRPTIGNTGIFVNFGGFLLIGRVTRVKDEPQRKMCSLCKQ